jgi:uncharacterized protein YjbI with pentapeptide repeats
MTDQPGVNWWTCGEDGCIGVALYARPVGVGLVVTSKCLAHASDEQRNAKLKQLGETGEFDARGVPLTEGLLKQILAAAPRDAEDHPTFKAARFEQAIFQGSATFLRTTFQGNAEFDGATIYGWAVFGEATFHRQAQFRNTTFQSMAAFSGATFQDEALFGDPTFQGDAYFGRATFQRGAWFSWATFQGKAWFEDATFQGEARFDEATFKGDVRFTGASFERARHFGPLLAYRGLQLDNVQFAQPVQIEASTIAVCCRQARFIGGVQLRLRWARVLLDDADLAAPSIVVGIPGLTSDLLAEREQQIVKAWQRLLGEAVSEQPRLLSLQRANVAGLGLASIDLADCRFAGAHNLDKLRLEADISFAAAPVRLSWDWRQVIAEECIWRAHRSGRWPKPVWPAWADDKPAVLVAEQIAGLYRALRKAREDAKDEPGAADFYYGEMEMRRHVRRGRGHAQSHGGTGAGSRGRVERGVLTAYWLVSGYGLRAWRALAWLAVVLVAFAGLLVWGGGYPPPASSPGARPAPTTTAPTSTATATTTPTSPAAARSTAPIVDRSLVGALLYGARTIIGLNPSPPPPLTQFGEMLLIAVRLLGPLLLGLALLALRGRVKR